MSSKENEVKAIELLDAALKRDPKFTQAYASLVEAHLAVYWSNSYPAESRARAEAALNSLKRLAPDAGQTHLADASFFYYGNRDYDHALEALEAASRSLPNDADVYRLTALIERRMGRWKDSVRHFATALALDPRSSGSYLSTVHNALLMRRYDEVHRLVDANSAAFPDLVEEVRGLRTEAAFAEGNLKAARREMEAMSPENDSLMVWRFIIPLCERNYAEAERAVAEREKRPEILQDLAPPAFSRGLIARARGDREKARQYFTEARPEFVRRVEQRPNDIQLLSTLGIIDAALGRNEEAIREAREAVEKRSIAKDALEGPTAVGDLACAYAWMGDRDNAFNTLNSIIRSPNAPSFGSLKLDPIWDDLRSDPRFAALLAEAAKPIL